MCQTLPQPPGIALMCDPGAQAFERLIFEKAHLNIPTSPGRGNTVAAASKGGRGSAKREYCQALGLFAALTVSFLLVVVVRVS